MAACLSLATGPPTAPACRRRAASRLRVVPMPATRPPAAVARTRAPPAWRPSCLTSHARPRLAAIAALGKDEPDDNFITSEDAFTSHIASAPVVVADFMARWCRKCIYIKPKLVTLMASKFPAVPLGFVDVNAVPSAVVSGAGVTKMPTIVIYVRGEPVGSYVAGESASAAVLKVEEMVKAALKQAGGAGKK